MPSTMLMWDIDDANNPDVQEDSALSEDVDWSLQLAELEGNDADKLVTAICKLFACDEFELHGQSKHVLDAVETLRDNVPKIVASITQVDKSAADARVAISKTRLEEATLLTRVEELERKLAATEATNLRKREVNDLVLAVSKQQPVDQLNAEIERLQNEIADTERRVKEQDTKYERISNVCASFFESLEVLKAEADVSAKTPTKGLLKESPGKSAKETTKEQTNEAVEGAAKEPDREPAKLSEPKEEPVKEEQLVEPMEELEKEPVDEAKKEPVEEQTKERPDNETGNKEDVQMEPMELAEAEEKLEKTIAKASPILEENVEYEEEEIPEKVSKPVEEQVPVKMETVKAESKLA